MRRESFMLWKLLLLVSSCATSLFAGQMGSTFTYNPLSNDNAANHTACERRITQSVVRLEITNSESYGGLSVCGTDINNTFQGQRNAGGTGFLVSLDPPILMTAAHNFRQNINDPRGILPNTPETNTNPCTANNLRFNFTGLGESVGCKRVLFTIPTHDAVFIELDRVPPNANYLRINRSPPEEGTVPVRLAGHPFASDTISSVQCTRDTLRTHNCDTLAGSSGSPLIDENCSVIGIHSGTIGTMQSHHDCRPDPLQFNAEEQCVVASETQDYCRNLTYDSRPMHGILANILANDIIIKDETKSFDDLERYGLAPLPPRPNASPVELATPASVE